MWFSLEIVFLPKVEVVGIEQTTNPKVSNFVHDWVPCPISSVDICPVVKEKAHDTANLLPLRAA